MSKNNGYNLTTITHHNSPYSREYIHEMGEVGVDKKHRISRRGIEARKACALRHADFILARLDKKIALEKGA